MKHLGFPKKSDGENDAGEKTAQAPPWKKATAAAAAAAEKPVAVFVPRRPLLDTPVAIQRSNPNCCITLLTTVTTAAVLGICFVVVAIPPLFLDTWHGQRIFVGIMIPLLTIICTVLLYYLMQQPQRIFNTAMVKLVKEMEHHSTYLSTAVDNVEKELTARGVSLGGGGGGVGSSFAGRQRSQPVTPEDSALPRSPGNAGLRAASSFYTNSASDILHGIEHLDESHDVVISTVHVGKEWKWFKDTLGKLKATTQSGGGFAGLAYQQGMVRMLSLAIARVEKLILSLYFSSFLLQRLNVVAPLNLWGANATSMGSAGGARFDMHARAAAALSRPSLALKNVSPVGIAPPPTQRAPLRLLGASCESLTESSFTIRNGRGKDSGAQELDSPAFSTSGALDVHGDGETPTDLTPPSSGQGYLFGRKVHLPRFTPLIGSGEASPSGGNSPQPQQQQQTQHAPTALAYEAKNGASAAAAATAGDDGPAVVDRTQRRASASASMPPPPLQRTVTKEGAHDAAAVLSHHTLRSATEDSDSEEDVDADGVATPLARLRSDRQTAAVHEEASQSVVVVRMRSNTGMAAGPDAATPRPGRQPPQSTTNAAAYASSSRVASLDVSASPLPVKPPLPPSSTSQQQLHGVGAVRPRRQAGTAVVANPSLTLLRGARFVNDEDSFFMTALVHVRKANLTCFSRLYAAQAHVRTDGKEKKIYFFNSGDSSFMRRSSYNPLTIFHISDVGGEREGLTVQEQRLLNFVYCKPENHSEVDSQGRARNAAATDLSSLAVKDGVSSGAASAAGTEGNPSPTGSIALRTVTSVFSDEVDAFILAMGLLPDRAMRLTFLPVHIEAVGRKGMSQSFSGSLTSASLKASAPTKAGRESDVTAAAASDGGVSNSEAEHPPPPPTKTLPVLECVVDDVLCVLTKIEITVDPTFQRPSKIVLVGVSLEDVTEGSERGVDDDDDDADGDLDSLAGAQETKRPLHSSAENSPNGRHSRSMVTPQTEALAAPAASSSSAAAVNGGVMAAPGYASGCTLGQEFREIILLESNAVTPETSLGSAS